METLSRRRFSQLALASFCTGLSLRSTGTEVSQEERFLITVHAGGGWDLSLYCDPKVNSEQLSKITYWSDTAEPREVNGITYAPVGNNDNFFTQYGSRTLVINGVDTQTNAHSAGERHTWTGDAGEGRPSLAVLFGATMGEGYPLPVINFGAFSSGLLEIQGDRVDPDELKLYLSSRIQNTGSDAEVALWKKYRDLGFKQALARRSSQFGKQGVISYQQYLSSAGSLEGLATALPSEMPEGLSLIDGTSELLAEIEVSLQAFRSGTTVAAECSAGGAWDTHSRSEGHQISYLSALNTSIDYLWTRAEALGLANKLTVVLSSDFGRTPYYNSSGGKDHWPINSYLVMDKRSGWGGRTLGLTDALQNAVPISPRDMRPDQNEPPTVPAEVHAALHKFLGIDGYVRNIGYDFGSVRNLNLWANG